MIIRINELSHGINKIKKETNEKAVDISTIIYIIRKMLMQFRMVTRYLIFTSSLQTKHKQLIKTVQSENLHTSQRESE